MYRKITGKPLSSVGSSLLRDLQVKPTSPELPRWEPWTYETLDFRWGSRSLQCFVMVYTCFEWFILVYCGFYGLNFLIVFNYWKIPE